ncbi:hypothetical protein [Pseudomonas sp. Fl4BN1]|uniref:hypothetical protein n=1 Tax=Pseudomonas sp. Fl4BN1 TaxID=2697651 RepID=UPI0013775A07|nr:hypothetical protein [Pseudomonas sp. Fl4BN1]NBF07891.1 hypothetical protein [Pseudomonas sp. Fl4BN1]
MKIKIKSKSQSQSRGKRRARPGGAFFCLVKAISFSSRRSRLAGEEDGLVVRGINTVQRCPGAGLRRQAGSYKVSAGRGLSFHWPL